MTGEDETVYPDRVDFDLMPDGGAIVRATYRGDRVYMRAYADLDAAREDASGMFKRSFPKPAEDEQPF